jgi:hypothetical protein
MARTLNGSTDKIATSSYTVASGAMTMAAWVMPITTGSQFNFIMNQNNAGLQYFQFGIHNTHKIDFFNSVNAGSGASGATVITNNVWHHIAATYDPGGGSKVYLDGVLDGSTAAVGSLQSITAILTVGYTNTPGQELNATLADCSQWSVGLTAIEIAALAKGTRPYSIRGAALTLWLSLDGYGHPALDRSIYARNGVLTGTSFAVGPPLVSAAPIFPGVPMGALAPPPPPPLPFGQGYVENDW